MSMKSQAEYLEAQKRMLALYPEIRQQLLQLPGVVKVGIGIKEKAGKLTGEPVFRVYVEEKKPASELPPGQLVPKEIQGFETDVVVVRPLQPEDDAEKYRPLKAGVQISADGGGGVGTLGCFAHLVSDNSVVVLSNHHVLYSGTATTNSEIGQPTFERSCCCTCNDIAVNLFGTQNAHLDCAIARLKPGITPDARIKEIGFITGINSAVMGQAVKKRGRTTGLTTGNVTNITPDGTGTKILEIEVKKNNGNDRFSRPGDSGSALLNDANEIIGLHKQGNNGDDVVAGQFESVSVGIQEVLDAMQAAGFQITIMTGTGGDELVELAPRSSAGLTDALWAIELRLQETEAGRAFWAVVQRNQRELLRLVNEVRPVTVTWHRKQGPAFLAALGRSTKEPSYRVPEQLEGITRQEAAIAILSALEANGSEALQADLALHAAALREAFVRGDTVDEMIRAWEQTQAGEAPLTRVSR